MLVPRKIDDVMIDVARPSIAGNLIQRYIYPFLFTSANAEGYV